LKNDFGIKKIKKNLTFLVRLNLVENGISTLKHLVEIIKKSHFFVRFNLKF